VRDTIKHPSRGGGTTPQRKPTKADMFFPYFMDTDHDLPNFRTAVPSSVITRDNIFTQQANLLCEACHAKVCAALHPHAVASFPSALTCSNRRREPTVLLPRLLLLLILLKSSASRLFQTSTPTCLYCLCQCLTDHPLFLVSCRRLA
jgi:hypothetical protein